MNDILEYMTSVEFQASHTVWEKNKRAMELEHQDLIELELVCYYISEARKANSKNPNVDYLVQELGNWLKKKHKKQEFLDSKMEKYRNYKSLC